MQRQIHVKGNAPLSNLRVQSDVSGDKQGPGKCHAAANIVIVGMSQTESTGIGQTYELQAITIRVC